VSPDAARVELTIPARADYIVVARLATAAVAARLCFQVETIEDLKLAVAEACTACVAAEPSANRTIAIVWEVRDGMLDVAVGDQGSEHDGLGVTIIRHLMDRVSFETHSGVTTLRMAKRLGDAAKPR
jgi:serine/threonine-protein kinase RsbW